MMNLNIFVVNIFLYGDPFLSKSVIVLTITLDSIQAELVTAPLNCNYY
jgi:hypothetical protein